MLARQYWESEILDCFKTVADELTRIRKIMERDKAPAKITIDNNGITMIPDLETFFEQLEDDHK